MLFLGAGLSSCESSGCWYCHGKIAWFVLLLVHACLLFPCRTTLPQQCWCHEDSLFSVLTILSEVARGKTSVLLWIFCPVFPKNTRVVQSLCLPPSQLCSFLSVVQLQQNLMKKSLSEMKFLLLLWKVVVKKSRHTQFITPIPLDKRITALEWCYICSRVHTLLNTSHMHFIRQSIIQPWDAKSKQITLCKFTAQEMERSCFPSAH